ncbi:hypothetical protein SCA6_003174 [Theobroma cacao]
MILELVPDYLTECIEFWQERLKNYFFHSIRITFDEFTSGLYYRSDAYIAIEYYLSSKSATRATRLKAESYKRKASLLFSSDHYEDIEDEFESIKVTWYKGKYFPNKEIIYSRAPDDKNYYTLVFHPKDRVIVMERYLNYVLQEGKVIKKKRRQRKLYMNSDDGWDYTLLEHLASFDSFAMDPEKKKEIINDLIAFSQGKEYYSKIGKAWKRDYLLYGPPLRLARLGNAVICYMVFQELVLAKNYLKLDSHPLFEKIGNLLEEVNMTPDVYEHLLHGRVGRDPKACLESLIEALETANEEKIEEEDAKTLETVEEEAIEEEIAKEEEIEEEDVKILETTEEENKKKE